MQKNLLDLKILRQIALFALLLCAPTALLPQKRNTGIVPNGQRILFLGVENPLTITVAGVPFSALSFSCINGSVEVREGKAYITPKDGGITRLSVYQGGMLLNMLEFKNYRLPDPSASVDGRTKGNITVNELLMAGRLSTAKADEQGGDLDVDYEALFTIRSFSVSGRAKDGYNIDITVQGFRFTQEVQDFIRRSVGSKIYFDNIKIAGPDGSIRKLPTLAFKITN